MTTVRIHGGRVGAMFRAHSKRLPAAARSGLREGAERGRTLLKRLTPVDLAVMVNAWQVHEQPYGCSLDNSAPHAGVIEGGARPHPVNEEGMKALREWVARNLEIVPVTRGKNAGSMRTLSSKQRKAMADDPENEHAKQVDRIAQAIAWKIRLHGQKGKFLVRNNLEKLAGYARRAVKEALERELNNPPR